MPVENTLNGNCSVIKFLDSLTIHNVAEIKAMLEGCTFTEKIIIDLSEVNEMDSAGFQLLYAFIEDLIKNNYDFMISSKSDIIKNFESTYRLEF
ncbi:MAG: STAS domain-containing protein [Calditerrivibrio sp.]|nr:STAS domain-containing protein [Calditerrivibrio sp.]